MANVDIYDATAIMCQGWAAPEPPVTTGGGTGSVSPTIPSFSNITVSYIMQASDSVTGVLYTWPVNDAPDWSGTKYNGPNSPTNIAISAKKTS